MELRSPRLYLSQKSTSTIDIHTDIEATLGPSGISHSPVTKYLREAQVTHGSEPTRTLIEDEGQRLIGEAIFVALAEKAFASVRRIASKAPIPRTTFCRHLVGQPGMTIKHLCWVPPTLSSQRKGICLQKAHEILLVLRSAKTILGRPSLPSTSYSSICTQTLSRCDYPETRHPKLESAI
jgi:hypothetical protein